METQCQIYLAIIYWYEATIIAWWKTFHSLPLSKNKTYIFLRIFQQWYCWVSIKTKKLWYTIQNLMSFLHSIISVHCALMSVCNSWINDQSYFIKFCTSYYCSQVAIATQRKQRTSLSTSVYFTNMCQRCLKLVRKIGDDLVLLVCDNWLVSSSIWQVIEFN